MSRPMPDSWCSGVIPPYMLDHLARHANPRVRQRAIATLHIDQQEGGIRASRPAMAKAGAAGVQALPPGQMSRAVHNAGNGPHLPGILARAEGQPATGDAAVDEAYDHLGATYQLFWQVYRR